MWTCLFVLVVFVSIAAGDDTFIYHMHLQTLAHKFCQIFWSLNVKGAPTLFCGVAHIFYFFFAQHPAKNNSPSVLMLWVTTVKFPQQPLRQSTSTTFTNFPELRSRAILHTFTYLLLQISYQLSS